MNSKPWMVGIDTETTGLELDEHVLLEVALIVVDENLNEIDHVEMIVNPTDVSDAISRMDDYVFNMHTASGLIDELENGDGAPLSEAEAVLTNKVREHFTENVRPVVFGNSVGFDRMFLGRYLPTFNEKVVHYRNVDVSTIKTLAEQWAPATYEASPKKTLTHRAIDDIRESLTELRHYRDSGFLNVETRTQNH